MCTLLHINQHSVMKVFAHITKLHALTLTIDSPYFVYSVLMCEQYKGNVICLHNKFTFLHSTRPQRSYPVNKLADSKVFTQTTSVHVGSTKWPYCSNISVSNGSYSGS